MESQLVDSGVQIDPSVNRLLQSPSQRDALHERGVELPLQPSQSDEESTGLLDELEIAAAAMLASPELETMRETGVVLPSNARAAIDDAAEAGITEVNP